ncbi:ABC transporter permease [Tissierella carlieri]|uniref:ABC transporter permease n=1 Tax=Tissierella carlieri TaxID=689904 RepID=A0ABT1SFT5_9FIRM|nr:ABC transporter permease [Tissierella carlieri]MCQ4925359.1 ABC transporter permease [Tissierella carlieri]
MMKVKITNITAMMQKTLKNMIANKAIVFMTILYPILALIFRMILPPEKYVEPLNSFYVMNITMIPILVMSSIIAEEKEKGILKYLIISGISSNEYLIGTTFCVLVGILFSSMMYSIFLLPTKIYNMFTYLFISLLGTIPSTLLGCIIGIKTKSQVEVGAKAAPIAMAIGMLPMFKGENVFADNIIKNIYSSVIFDYMGNNTKNNYFSSIIVVVVNIIILAFLFSVVYKKSKLDENR